MKEENKPGLSLVRALSGPRDSEWLIFVATLLFAALALLSVPANLWQAWKYVAQWRSIDVRLQSIDDRLLEAEKIVMQRTTPIPKPE